MRRLALLWLVIVVCCGLFIGIAHGLYQKERQHLDEELQRSVIGYGELLQSRLQSSFSALHQLAVLFRARSDIDSYSFQTVSEPIVSQFTELNMLAWVPKLDDDDRAFAEAYWKSYFPNFQITERQRQKLVRALPRQYYLPGYYVAPLASNERYFGFDFGSEPSIRASLQRARDSGELVVSEGQQLPNQTQMSVMAMLPIYRSLSLTLHDRRRDLIGYVFGEFDVAQMVEPIFWQPQMQVAFQLMDDSQDGTRLYGRGEFSRVSSSPMFETKIEAVGGRIWRLQAQPQASYYRQQMTLVPWVVAIGGCFAVMLIAFIVHQLQRRNEAIAKLVRARTEELNGANQKLVRLSLTDGLTEIGNRRQFDAWLDQEWESGCRSGKPMTLMLLDVDHFKAYNDNYGHRAGDKVLRLIAGALKRRLNRPRDLLARYGGEEFAVILPETTDNAAVLAQALCETIIAEQIPHKFSSCAQTVTVSIGVATVVPEHNSEARHLVELADQALYRAKADGRNRYVAFGGKPKLVEHNHGDAI